MKYEIPLSVMQECYPDHVLTLAGNEKTISRLKENDVLTCEIGKAQGTAPGDKKLLTWVRRNIPCLICDGGKWYVIQPYPCLPSPHVAYRLHPDCVVVDDTAEKWIEHEVGVAHSGHYFVKGTPTDRWRIGKAVDHRDFVCIAAIDEAGDTWYLDRWSPYPLWASNSIEDLVSRLGNRGNPQGRLTPTHVIFEGGE